MVYNFGHFKPRVQLQIKWQQDEISKVVLSQNAFKKRDQWLLIGSKLVWRDQVLVHAHIIFMIIVQTTY